MRLKLVDRVLRRKRRSEQRLVNAGRSGRIGVIGDTLGNLSGLLLDGEFLVAPTYNVEL